MEDDHICQNMRKRDVTVYVKSQDFSAWCIVLEGSRVLSQYLAAFVLGKYPPEGFSRVEPSKKIQIQKDCCPYYSDIDKSIASTHGRLNIFFQDCSLFQKACRVDIYDA